MMLSATSSSMTMVVPPAGVSSTMSSPPMALVKPRATARPSPTPAPWEGLSPSRWNGWKTRSRSRRRDARAAVDDADQHLRSDLAGLDPHRRPFGRSGRGRCPPGWRPPARAAPGRHAPVAAIRARRPPPCWPAPPARPAPRGRPPRGRRGAALGATAPAWIRLMSSRLPTSVVRRSVSSSMVRRNSLRSTSDQAMSGWRRLLADALIPANGVRRSCDTAWSSALRSSLASARAAAWAAWAPIRRRSMAAASCATKALSTRRSSAARSLPRMASTRSRTQRTHLVGLGRASGGRSRPPPSPPASCRRPSCGAAPRRPARTPVAGGRPAPAVGPARPRFRPDPPASRPRPPPGSPRPCGGRPPTRRRSPPRRR